MKKVFAGAAAVLILLVGSAGALLWWGAAEAGAAEARVTEMLERTCESNVWHPAVFSRYMADSVNEAIDRDGLHQQRASDFKRFAGNMGAFRDLDVRSWNVESGTSGTRGTLLTECRFEKRTVVIEFILLKERGAWQVEIMNFP